MSFAIMTDTAANLPKEIAVSHDITILPMRYLMSGETHTCLYPEEFDDAVYYEKLKHGESVKTSQIVPTDYINAMRPKLEAGQDILFIGLSSGVSGSYASAVMAKEELQAEYPDRTVEVVDSLGASLGEGLLVLRAVKCRANGMDVTETANRINNLRMKMYQYFFVDDLMHLRRTGRLSGGVAIVGTVLGVKPLLKGDQEGHIVANAKVRGRKQAIKALAEKYFSLVQNAAEQTIGISHTNCKEDAEYLKKMIMEKLPPKEIILVKHEPATGSHLGPGSLALYFESDLSVRYQ